VAFGRADPTLTHAVYSRFWLCTAKNITKQPGLAAKFQARTRTICAEGGGPARLLETGTIDYIFLLSRCDQHGLK
jgi:hypothetical protein